MVDTGFINTIREIWWDIRPHHNFGTVEVRVCDMPGTLEEVLGIAALTQCLIKALSDDIDKGAYQHDCHPMMVRQNKWRACRYGRSAELVNAYTFEVQSVQEIVAEMIDRLRPDSRELGCEEYLDYVGEMANSPSWSEKQLQILLESNDRSEIVRRLTERSRITERSST